MKRSHFSVQGFTVVELLVVVVVIGILAAVVVVAYSGVQAQAHDSAVKSDLKNMSGILELWNVKNGGYPDPSVAATNSLEDVGLKVSKDSYAVSPTTVNNILYCYDGANRTRTYAIIVLSKSGNAFYIAANQSGIQSYTNEWGESAGEDAAMCTSLGDGITNTYRGYAGNSSPDWRPWTGVN